jgi:hypothetical protein
MAMTEEEWLGCADPATILRFLENKASERKLRVFAVACCYHFPHILAHRPYQEATELAERFADGHATQEELANVFCSDNRFVSGFDLRTDIDLIEDWPVLLVAHPCPFPIEAVASLTRITVAEATSSCTTFNSVAAMKSAAFGWQSQVLRDIFGNPFHLIAINPTWLTATVANLATAAYEERTLPSGELDNARLAILADALEESGCDNADILGHLRSPGPHVRGCHVLDFLLGKE